MKKKSAIFIFIFLFLCSTGFVYAEKKSPWDFSILSEFAYYPKSDFIVGANHFVPITGVYNSVELRVAGLAGYTIPLPFGDNSLVSGNRLYLLGKFELSPVSMGLGLSASFSPIAFLDFDVGTIISMGWDFQPLNIKGLAIWNQKTKAYDSRIFKSAHIEAWFQGTFMFDLAALIPGEWNHIVTLNSFKAEYIGLTNGGENGNPWLFQGTGGQANGFRYIANFLLGYQMPLVLQMVGGLVELEGYFDGKTAYNKLYHNMDPNFMSVYLSPVTIFTFTEKDELTIQFRFGSRRSYTEAYETSAKSLELTTAGREWFFDRIAFSYKHNF